MATIKLYFTCLQYGEVARYRVSHEKLTVFKIEFKNTRQVLVTRRAKKKKKIKLACSSGV